MIRRHEAAIVGIGETEFSNNSGRSELTLACEAIAAAAADAGLSVHEIDGTVRQDMDSVVESALVSALGIENLRFYAQSWSGGAATGGMLALASMAVLTGHASVVACYRSLNGRSGRHRLGRPSVGPAIAGVEAFDVPYGMTSPAQRFALFARRHMIEYGTTSQQFGAVAVQQRANAQRNPRAQTRGRPITLDDHQASRIIADPLRLLDCCLESDGAVAYLVTRPERARDLRQPPVYVMAATQATGPQPHGQHYRRSLAVSEATFGAAEIYRQAGVGPDAVDVAEFYDHFSPFVIFALEAYGFCRLGEGGPFVEAGETAWPTGRIPTNTHGGHLSEAYMHGLGHVTEAVRQLRGSASCQVASAEIALVGSATAHLSSAALLHR